MPDRSIFAVLDRQIRRLLAHLQSQQAGVAMKSVGVIPQRPDMTISEVRLPQPPERRREQAVETLMALTVPGSGPLELARREAEAIIDALNLSWPCSRCDRVSDDGVCWYHNV